MKVTELFEGKYVVKNRDGVEKRFTDPKSAQALAFIASGKKADTAALKKEIADATTELKKNDLDVVWDAISRIQDWEALDWIDLVRMQAVPYLVKAISKKQDAYSMELRKAVAWAARTNGTEEFDPLLKFFDKACKDAGEGGWKKYARSMTSYGKSKGA